MSLSPSVRLVSNDPSYVSLQDIYDQHCEEIGITREDPVLLAGEKCKAVLRELGNTVSVIVMECKRYLKALRNLANKNRVLQHQKDTHG